MICSFFAHRSHELYKGQPSVSYAEGGCRLTQGMTEHLREWHRTLFIESILLVVKRRRHRKMFLLRYKSHHLRRYPTYSELYTEEDHTSDPEGTAGLQVSMCFLSGVCWYMLVDTTKFSPKFCFQ